MRLRLERAVNRNTKCHWVSFGIVHVLFSYDTPVFAQFNNEFRKRGYISRTTSRHLKESVNLVTLEHATVVDEAQMDEFIAKAFVDAVTKAAIQRIERATQ